MFECCVGLLMKVKLGWVDVWVMEGVLWIDPQMSFVCIPGEQVYRGHCA